MYGSTEPLLESEKIGYGTVDTDQESTVPRRFLLFGNMKDWEAKDTIITVDDDDLEPCFTPTVEDFKERECIKEHVAEVKGRLDFGTEEEISRRRREREVQVLRYGPVHHAAACGNSVLLKYLLEERPVNSRASNHSTPLHLAARYLQLECVRILLDREDVDIDALDDDGITPLQSAGLDASRNVADKEEEKPGSSLYIRRSGSALPVVELLIERGAKIPNDDGRNINTFIHTAIARQDIQLVQYMMKKSWDILRLRNHCGYNVLHLCVDSKDLETLKTILLHTELVKDILNEKTPDGLRPLSLAAVFGWVEGVRELLQAGAKIMEEIPGSFNVLHWAATSGTPEVIDMLLSEATRNGNIFDIVNAPWATGETPLFLAVGSWNRQCVHHFLNWGADVNKIAEGNFNLIHQAITRLTGEEDGSNPSDMLLYLLEYPELKHYVNKVTTKNISVGLFGTPVNIAAWSGNLDCVKVLVQQYKADVTEPFDLYCDINGIQGKNWTPLHSAAYNGKVEIIRYIVDMNPTTLSDITVDGWTPLHVAAWNNQEESIKCLLKLGGSLAETTKEGTSALQMILDKHLHPHELLMDIFDSCIIESNEKESSYVQINYDPVMPHDDKVHFDVLMTLAKWDEKLSEKINKDDLILHPLMETSVYIKVEAMMYTILAICLIHSLFVLGFYFTTVCWQTNEPTALIDIIGLMLLIIWVHFSLDKDLVTEDWRHFFSWRTWPLFLCQLLAILMTLCRFTALSWVSDYSSLVLVPMVLLVTLRILYYFNPATITTIVIMLQVLAKVLAIAGVMVVLFMVCFMLKPSVDDPLNEFGKMVVEQIKLAMHYLSKEVKKYFRMDVVQVTKRLLMVVPLVATYIIKINPYTGYLTKFIKTNERKGHVKSIVEQANILERMDIWFQKCQERTRKKINSPKITRVYHSKKLHFKNHGSVVLGNRVWECVANWYIQQEGPGREKGRELFLQAKGTKKSEDSSCTCTK